jgi:hypothetical protein
VIPNDVSLFCEVSKLNLGRAMDQFVVCRGHECGPNYSEHPELGEPGWQQIFSHRLDIYCSFAVLGYGPAEIIVF